MNLALFDFDGTITNKDSLFDFIFFAANKGKIISGLLLLSPILVLNKLKIISSSKAKELVLKYFFNGWSENYFNEIASHYSDKRIPMIIRKNALNRLNYHKSNGDRIVVVTASAEIWVNEWCARNGFDLIGTKLETINGEITGKLSTLNCKGIEKVFRIKEKYNLKDFEKIFAYGDSGSDMPMLCLADEKYYKWKRMND